MRLYLIEGCPFAHRASIALREKKQDFEPVFFEGGKRPAELESSGPNAKSPTLVDAGIAVWDSAIVLAYVEDKLPAPPLMPADAAGRAEVRMTIARINAAIGPAHGALVGEALKPAGERNAARLLGAKRGFTSALPEWDEQLASREYLVRGQFTLADITLYTFFPSAEALAGLTIPSEHERLHAWYERISARPSTPRVRRSQSA